MFAAKAATTRHRRPGQAWSCCQPRPAGGNLTGINFFATEVAAKRLELLRELLPGAARTPCSSIRPGPESSLRAVEAAARTMGVQIQVLNANTSREIDAAFESIGRERPDALFVGVSPFLLDRRV